MAKASKHQYSKNFLYFISIFKQFFTRKILYIYIKQECIPKTKVTREIKGEKLWH